MTKDSLCSTCNGKGRITKTAMELERYYINCPVCNTAPTRIKQPDFSPEFLDGLEATQRYCDMMSGCSPHGEAIVFFRSCHAAHTEKLLREFKQELIYFKRLQKLFKSDVADGIYTGD